MAKIFTDFSEYTAGAAPSDWSVPADFVDYDIFEVRTSTTSSGKKLHLANGALIKNRLRVWDAISSGTDFEVAFKAIALGDSDSEIGIRAQSGPKAYLLGHYNDEATVRRLNDGSVTAVANSGTSVLTDNWYWQRVRVNSTALKVKIWQDGDPEPDQWRIETTDSSITNAGLLGIFGREANKTVEYDVFGVGTNGDTAPTEPVPTIVEISGTIAGSSNLAGLVNTAAEISGTIPAISVLSASADLIVELSGSISALSSMSGSLKTAQALSSTLAANSSLSGSMIADVSVAGSIRALSSMSGAIGLHASVSGQIASISSLSGVAGIGAQISGIMAATSQIVGLLTVVESPIKYLVANGVIIRLALDGRPEFKAAMTAKNAEVKPR